MSFASPLWLLALLPWAGVVVWLLIGRGEPAAVPFLNLWQSPNPIPRNSRAKLHLPPLGLALVLLAMLLAVLAASQPIIRFIPHSVGPKISIIVDSGLTMPKWKELARQVQQPLRDHFGDGPVDLLMADGKSIQTDRANWPAVAAQYEPSPANTRESIITLAKRTLAGGDEPVILLSNQDVSIDDPRLIQIAPTDQPQNVGIVSASARSSPRPQVMVVVRNDSDQQTAGMSVAGASRTIDLPPRGQQRSYFVDLDQPPKSISVELGLVDDIAIDNRATLDRSRAWPKIESVGELALPLDHMIQTYAKLRPRTDESAQMIVTTNPTALVDGRMVVVAPVGNPAANGESRTSDHPINANLDWPRIVKRGVQVASPPDASWQPIVWIGDRPIVAVQQSPVRQVWVGFDSDAFARSSDFVIFWTNVFDWAGEGGEKLEFHGVHAEPIPSAPDTRWQEKLHALPASTRVGRDISSSMAIGAIALIFAAGITWTRPR